jgi:hypothetical protein
MTNPAPRIYKAAWTLSLAGDCIFCEKKCSRSRTFYAKSMEDAQAQADAAMSGLCHRKCGGY